MCVCVCVCVCWFLVCFLLITLTSHFPDSCEYSVGFPYKEAIFGFCDEVHPLAQVGLIQDVSSFILCRGIVVL
jgi:hypothetical protein